MIYHHQVLLVHQLHLLVKKILSIRKKKFFFNKYLVDAADSGAGNLEISISRDGKNIPNYVQNEGSARFRVNFVPDKPCIHYIRIKLNGIHIHGKKEEKEKFFLIKITFCLLLNRITFWM